MHTRTLAPWQHDHTFGQDRRRIGESRTLLVAGITLAMMAVEIVAGLAFGSMALLADGLHMGSHAAALTIAVLAYVYARRHARDERFNFGVGKVNALGGFTGAVLLAVFALLMVWESSRRTLHPVAIAFDQAIAVAGIGLAVNGICAVILGHHGHHGDDGHAHIENAAHHDHNLRAARPHAVQGERRCSRMEKGLVGSVQVRHGGIRQPGSLLAQEAREEIVGGPGASTTLGRSGHGKPVLRHDVDNNSTLHPRGARSARISNDVQGTIMTTRASPRPGTPRGGARTPINRPLRTAAWTPL